MQEGMAGNGIGVEESLRWARLLFKEFRNTF